jgi:hypothetical protein
MTALLSRRRLNESAAQSVDDPAQVKQIAKSSQIAVVVIAGVHRRGPSFVQAPIGPFSRNERSTAVRYNDDKVEDAVQPNPADHRERLTFKDVTFAGDSCRIRHIMATGSLWLFPSGAFRMPSFRSRYRAGSLIGACCI